MEYRGHDEFILVRASEESNPTSSYWCRLLEDCVIVQGVASLVVRWGGI
jgi:hypothetical protein